MMVQIRENKLQRWPPLDATGTLNNGWFLAKVPSELTNPPTNTDWYIAGGIFQPS